MLPRINLVKEGHAWPYERAYNSDTIMEAHVQRESSFHGEGFIDRIQEVNAIVVIRSFGQILNVIISGDTIMTVVRYVINKQLLQSSELRIVNASLTY